MKVLVVGGGGREHALAWKLARSPLVERLYCAPGNPGMAALGECVPVAPDDLEGLASFAKERQVDLTVVGPEDPLARGIVDRFAQDRLKAFGPSAAAARLEASKTFAKRIMDRYDIPTAAYATFTDAAEALRYVREMGAPIVIKADGLAAGKGVTVARTLDAAVEAIRTIMTERAFGNAGKRVLIEECLEGEEASILAFTDGRTVLPMVPSQDHKPVFDGDAGPNTGGMGAYSPAPVVDEAMLDAIVRRVLEPCVNGMAAEGAPYRGVLYAGLMMTEAGPKVVEFNCRFGDPETQVVLPRMESDLAPTLLACCDGTLHETPVEWKEDACVTVVMASGGYPGSYEKGHPIVGIERAQAETGVIVFHAGTKTDASSLLTNGGRVLNVTGLAPDIPGAIRKAYEGVARIRFDGAHYRSDIGAKALTRLRTAN